MEEFIFEARSFRTHHISTQTGLIFEFVILQAMQLELSKVLLNPPRLQGKLAEVEL